MPFPETGAESFQFAQADNKRIPHQRRRNHGDNKPAKLRISPMTLVEGQMNKLWRTLLAGEMNG
jgi:hypothetical protein